MKLHILTLTAGLLIGGLLVYKLRPSVVKTEIKEVIKQQTTTVTKRTKQKDGTIVTETTSVKNTEKRKQKLKTEPTKKSTTVSLYLTVPLNGKKQETGIAITKEVLANISLYGSLQTDGQIGFGVSYSW